MAGDKFASQDGCLYDKVSVACCNSVWKPVNSFFPDDVFACVFVLS